MVKPCDMYYSMGLAKTFDTVHQCGYSDIATVMPCNDKLINLKTKKSHIKLNKKFVSKIKKKNTNT